MSPREAAQAVQSVITDRTQMSWPIVVSIVGATWFLSSRLSGIQATLDSLVAIAAKHDSRLSTIEALSADRGPRIEALERSIGR